MLRNLLTPLSSRFSATFPNTPHTIDEEDDVSPEDFARDVLIELMRNSITKLKDAQDVGSRLGVLEEILRVAQQDACTKDVFREMDGFLVLINLFTTVDIGQPPTEQILEQLRLAFSILSAVLKQHTMNMDYFRLRVGYESLSRALSTSILSTPTQLQTLGLLLSFAVQDFSLSDYYHPGRSDAPEIQAHLDIIRQPGGIRVLWDTITYTPPESRAATLQALECLTSRYLRNRAVLNNLNVASSLLHLFLASPPDSRERKRTQKTLRRVLELGVSTSEARLILRSVVLPDDRLHPDVLEIVRGAARGRWPTHISFMSPASLSFTQSGVKALPSTGFTYMAWLWIEKLPTHGNQSLFAFDVDSTRMISLEIHPDGKLSFKSTAHEEPGLFPRAAITKARWTHIALVHYTHRSLNPTIRFFIDGVFCGGLNWPYPKSSTAPTSASYIIGDDAPNTTMRWCLSTSYFISVPLDNELHRFIHHLGPKYAAKFQSDELINQLTYEASTSLNIHLFNLVPQTAASGLLKILKSGVGFNEDSVSFLLKPSTLTEEGQLPDTRWDEPTQPSAGRWKRQGDIMHVESHGFDYAVWKLGGAAVYLRLVQLASNSHELSRALGVLTDGLRNSWQNSEDMEQLRGYDILNHLLRSKAHLINMSGFETLFEFFGLNFRSTDHSTIVNAVGYRAIALDFLLWSRTDPEIQRAHLEHFTILVQTSRYKRFNIKQRYHKMAIVRKFLFVLQTNLYQPALLPVLIDALRAIVEANFSPDEAIKPLLSMIAANVHADTGPSASPRSAISRIDHGNQRERAECVMIMLVSLLCNSSELLRKFAAAVPFTRICLLLLGDRPSPTVATQVLKLVRISIDTSQTFVRKFELVSGWAILKNVLPYAWSKDVHQVAFDILLDYKGNDKTIVRCPNIIPAIIASLHRGLQYSVTDLPILFDTLSVEGSTPPVAPEDLEDLLEAIIQLHSTSPSFKQVFKSTQVTQQFIDTQLAFASAIKSLPEISQRVTSLMDKMSHLAIALALDPSVPESLQVDLTAATEEAQRALNPNAPSPTIDPKLIPARRMSRHRSSSSISSTAERAVQKSLQRLQDWRTTIMVSERKRLHRTAVDIRENQRQIASLTDWVKIVTNERGLWANPTAEPQWKLDDTEGPYRVRKKLEPTFDHIMDFKVDPSRRSDGAGDVEPDVQSVINVEVPPWAESYELSSAETEDHWADDDPEDKHRRVRHQLEPGDVIESVTTVARVIGVDSSAGLLIFGRNNLYFLDGLVENDDGEVIDAHYAPRKLLFVPGSTVELDGRQGALRWPHDKVLNHSNRSFLFRDVGIEIYFQDSISLFLVFLDKKQRQLAHQRLSAILQKRVSVEPQSSALLKSPGFPAIIGRMGARVLSGLRPDELSIAQRKWQTREISNFTYLSILNQSSGRTPSDATQYPVFPWVIQDYTSTTLDLKSEETYRDLSKPMGALTDARRDAASTRYTNLESVGEKPFHYGTHFSSSMIVCHFMIRLQPFTGMFKTLQGGDWDLPDRLFTDIKKAYDSASKDIRGDVRELIPEFYNLPEFLENLANLDFGRQQSTNEKIHNVGLPPWAKEDPYLFVTLNREALESEHVSQHLHEWIDLIWGYKQRDPASLNVFHPLSYEGSIDLDKITDELEREATVGIIHNFGQTPKKLFQSPHPQRIVQGTYTLPLTLQRGIVEDYRLLEQTRRATRDLGPGCPVYSIFLDSVGGIGAHSTGVMSIPPHAEEQVEWYSRGGRSDEVRIVVDRKVVQVIESVPCNIIAFADGENMASGGNDHTVRLWKLIRNYGVPLRVTVSHVMRGHKEPVICLSASRTWSVVVSGSKDGSAIVWDLNRGTYVASIWHGNDERHGVHLVSINESTGNIATCSQETLCLHTINARRIAELQLRSTSIFPSITSIAFLEREYTAQGIIATAGSDGMIVLRTWNTDDTPAGGRAEWKFRILRELIVRKSGAGRGRDIQVTALKFIGEVLYHGQDDGKVYSWTIPEQP